MIWSMDLLSVVLTGFLGAFLFFETSKKEFSFYEKHKKGIFYCAAACIVLLACAMMLSAVQTGLPFRVKNLPAACLICGLVFFLLALFSKTTIITQRLRRVLRFASRAAVLTVMLELCVFNFNAYHLLSADYQRADLTLDYAAFTNFTKSADGYRTVQAGGASIEFPQVGMPVGTVKIEAQSTTNAAVKVSVNYADETNRAYRTGIKEAEIIRGNEKSSVLTCNYSGNVSKLRFDFSAGKEESITVKAIVLNEPVPFEFSFMRFFSVFGAAMLVYLFYSSAQMKKKYKDNQTVCKGAALVIALFMVFAALGMTQLYRVDSGVTLEQEFTSKTGNQITQELVDAFEKGSVTLDVKPSEGLKALENPYDWSQRIESGAAYAWDHVYYEGNYYSYYGIAPVVLLFLPYHLLTGFYFPTVWAVFLFGAIGLFFLMKTVMAFFDRFFRDVPSSFVLMALIMALVSCGVWFNFITPNFYEIAQTSGFACVTAGSFFLLSSNIVGDGKIRRWRVALSGVLLSLAVLCRPTLAVYCIAAVAFLIAGFQKLRRQTQEQIKQGKARGGFFRRYGVYILCAAIPFLVIGGAQMLYNYARFGSFMDFGIDYSLTINDFTRSQYHTHLAAIGLYNFLLAFPSVNTAFPFVHSAFSTLDLNGYYFIANQTAIGLFFRALPMFSYFFAFRAYRCMPKEKRHKAALLLLLSCVAAPLIIIISIWESGYGVRYCTDFSWQLLLGAFAIAFTIYLNTKNAGVKRILSRVLTGSFLLCVVVNFAFVFEYQFIALSKNGTGRELLLSLARTFEFWH